MKDDTKIDLTFADRRYGDLLADRVKELLPLAEVEMLHVVEPGRYGHRAWALFVDGLPVNHDTWEVLASFSIIKAVGGKVSTDTSVIEGQLTDLHDRSHLYGTLATKLVEELYRRFA